MNYRGGLAALFATVALLVSTAPGAWAEGRTITVMSPLYIGNNQEWDHFRASLREAKKAGIDAVTTDVWWGIVQAEGPNNFNWSYYHRMASEIRAAGLKWIPILSTHACGGNIGDSVNIPLPKWIWSAGGGRSIRFKSEGGNESDDYVSFWDSHLVIDHYKNFYAAFRDEFKGDADLVREIIVGLGPSGELHFPSYHAHDRNLGFAGFPNRGALQASSDSAVESFRNAMFAKYGSLEGISKAWGGRKLGSRDEIRPPRTVPEVSGVFYNNTEFSAYGQDLFDWYRASMLESGRLVGDAAMKIFGEGAFGKTAVGFKIPGVHWSMHNRYAELTSGLISTRQPEAQTEWNDKAQGMGYRKLVQLFSQLQVAHASQPVNIYFTAGMTPNGDDSNMGDRSRAEDLTRAIAALTQEYQLHAGIENALDTDLMKPWRVDLLKRALHDLGYSSASFLRLDDVLASQVMRQALSEIHSYPPLKDCERRLTLYPKDL